jgi:hypothetical protein
VVEPLSLRQDFIREFALLRGVSRSALDAICRSNKRGYNAAHDAHFDRFRLLFRETKPTCRFAPENILPGDLVTLLQRMSASGSAYASIKDASASISMACREATDGDVALGDRESVKRFLKSIRIQEPLGRRKQLVLTTTMSRHYIRKHGRLDPMMDYAKVT